MTANEPNAANVLYTPTSYTESFGDNLLIKYSDDITDPVPILSINKTLVASAGNISVIGGKQKSRKSFFICMLSAAYLKGEYGMITANISEKRPILLFDTEMGKTHVQKALRRICQMCGQNGQDDRLKVFFLRECTAVDTIEVLKAQMAQHNPGLVIIDGIVDMCNNFNDIGESTSLVQLLMSLSSLYNCHITTVLHENKGVTDSNLRGHLGTILAQKSETVFQLQRDGDNTKVLPAATRNISFQDFFFKINEDGLPVILGVAQTPLKQTATDKMVEAMRLTLDDKALCYGDLQREYMEVAGVKERTAQTHISNCRKMNIIFKSEDDEKYRCTQYR